MESFRDELNKNFGAKTKAIHSKMNFQLDFCEGRKSLKIAPGEAQIRQFSKMSTFFPVLGLKWLKTMKI